jgi:adenine-specific DNA glycosylase
VVLVDPRGRTLLVKPEKAETNGLFSGMWQFPAVEVRENAGVELRRHLREMRVARVLVELKTVKHSVTHREITLRPYVMRVRELPRVDGARVVRLKELYEQEGGSKEPPLHKRYIPAISSATRKIARAAILDSVKKARRIGAARR